MCAPQHGLWSWNQELARCRDPTRFCIGDKEDSARSRASFHADEHEQPRVNVPEGGRRKEAEELDVKVMKTSRTVLGAEHPHTLTSISNLALTYWNQGRWKEAERLSVKVIETMRTALGAEHPDTPKSMATLA
nr:kinesin light chain 3 [Quercus suber]